MDAPFDDLVRARPAAVEMRADGDEMPTLFGYFARFNEWAEIDSWFEGQFMERLARGAFRKTIDENRDQVKVLYDHGHDFQLGNKVLGPISDLRERQAGVYYEVPLLDTSYNRDLIPGLEAGLYGASFRFRVIKDEWNDEPGASDTNPKGLPERTIKEVRLYEFGPVTFPAYTSATAGVRSLTGDYIDRLLANPRLAERLNTLRTPPPVEEAAPGGMADQDGAATPATEPHTALRGLHSHERFRALRESGVLTP